MKISPWLYLAGLCFTSSAIIVEQVEKRRARKAEEDKWRTAAEELSKPGSVDARP